VVVVDYMDIVYCSSIVYLSHHFSAFTRSAFFTHLSAFYSHIYAHIHAHSKFGRKVTKKKQYMQAYEALFHFFLHFASFYSNFALLCAGSTGKLMFNPQNY